MEVIKNMTKLVNLTPHEIDIMNDKNEVVMKIPPSGKIARVTEDNLLQGHVNEIPLYYKAYKEMIEELPDPVYPKNRNPDSLEWYDYCTLYIVSLPVAQVVGNTTNRHDMLIVGDSVRNEKGEIIGTRSLAVIT